MVGGPLVKEVATHLSPNGGKLSRWALRNARDKMIRFAWTFPSLVLALGVRKALEVGGLLPSTEGLVSKKKGTG
jgi:hypothetical protein